MAMASPRPLGARHAVLIAGRYFPDDLPFAPFWLLQQGKSSAPAFHAQSSVTAAAAHDR
jgi:hypothetical protein